MVELASGLPSGWVVVCDTVYGQITIGPAKGTHWRSTDFVAAPDGRYGFLTLRKLSSKVT